MSIRARLIAVMTIVLIGTVAIAGGYSYVETHAAVSARLTDSELPATVRAVRNQIEKELVVYLTASQDMADNVYVRDWIANGENPDGLKAWAAYATAIQSRTQAFNASLVSDATRKYYDQNGFNEAASKDIHFWFDDFLKRNAPYEIVLDRNESTGNKFKMFTNVRMDVDGKLASVGLGIDAEALAARIAAIKVGESGYAYLVAEDGSIKIHKNLDLLGKAFKTLPGFAEIADRLLDKTEVDGEAKVNVADYAADAGRVIVASSYIPSIRSFVFVEVPESEVFGEINASFAKVGLIVLLIVVAAIVAIVFIAQSIAKPIAQATHIIDSIARGDTKIAVPDSKRRDEIGRMLAAMKALKESVVDAFRLRKMVEDLPTNVMLASPHDRNAIRYANKSALATLKRLEGKLPLSDADLIGAAADRLFAPADNAAARLADPKQLPFTSIVACKDEVLKLQASAIVDGAGQHIDTIVVLDVITRQERLASDFEANVKTLTEAASKATVEVSELVGEMGQAAGETTAKSNAAAEAAEMASGNVQAVAAATEELSSSISEISRQVQQSAGITSRAVSEAKATDETVQSLAVAADKIGGIVQLINQIASQTNLLALNATIEAARAGEAGRGFAVVASEVKNLATQTGKATEEIAGHISAIQDQTGNAVEAIRRIGETIGEVNAIVAAIAAAVEEQGAATAEIARNVQQASEGTNAVSANIKGAAKSADATGTTAGVVRENADQLSGTMDKLRIQVDQFLVGIHQA